MPKGKRDAYLVEVTDGMMDRISQLARRAAWESDHEPTRAKAEAVLRWWNRAKAIPRPAATPKGGAK